MVTCCRTGVCCMPLSVRQRGARREDVVGVQRRGEEDDQRLSSPRRWQSRPAEEEDGMKKKPCLGEDGCHNRHNPPQSQRDLS